MLACMVIAVRQLAVGLAFVSQPPKPVQRHPTALRAANTDSQVTATLPTRIADLSPEELKARKEKALDIWDSLKIDIKDEIDKYNTFRIDKFEEFMRQDSRGMALYDLYKPGTPEYAEFFEEHMGPYIFELAKEKLGEGLSQALGVIVVVGTVVAIVAVFGTDIVQTITAPFTGFAEEFTRLYGF